MGRLLNGWLMVASLLLLAMLNPVSAQVSVSSMFSSGMVLQQNTDVNIWGWANAGDTVSVTGSWDNQTVKTVTEGNKKWMLKLRTPVAKADGTSFTVTVKGSNILVFKDVLIGEVWLLSGQSNMEMPLEGWTGAPIEGSAPAIAAATYPNIRLLIAGKKSSSVPMANITKNYTNSTWTACSPASVGSFSAAGYFFGKELHTELNIPIGLIQSAWGGSSCETWANPSSLEFVTDYKNKGPWTPTKADDNHTPTVLYNGMIAPIVPFTLAGVLWYQGETNVGRPQQLTELFPAMIEGWRQDFRNSTLPFYYVQLCAWSGNGGTSLPETWEGQSYAQLLMNTGMTGTLDISDITNIHPAKKEPIGHRLALWALAKTYGKESLVHSGPQYRSMQAEGSKLRLSFDHAGSGLKAENNAPLQFEIAGSNLIFYPANTFIDQQTLLVWNDNIAVPKHVRYAWSGTATASLFNNEGLPATPFRTNTPAYMQPVKAMMLTGSELLREGEQTTLSWTTIGAQEVALNGEPVAASGTLQIKPAANTTYTLVAKGDQSIVTKNITVNVIPDVLYNWSVNRTATALSTNTGSNASLAFDTNPATAWKSISSNNQWITLDLGEPVPLSNVFLHWGDAYAKAYQIQVSDDNRTWKTVYTETAGDGGIDNVQNLNLSARYVRMLGTLMATAQGFTLNEMMVYSIQKPITGALKDKNGNLLRGTPMVLGKALSESVAFALNTANWETIRNNGYNTIRVCWVDPWYKSHAKDHWTVTEVLPYFDKCVQNATATGMNIIINYHDVGAQQESDKTYQFSLEKEFWNAVAPRYKDNDLVYYEPANEPTFVLSDYLKADFKESYLQLYNTIRTHAPERQVLFFSFNTIASDIVNVVDNYKDHLDWEHTTVAYHMYNSSSSAAVKTLMAYHPVICTEWFYDHVSRLPGNEFIRQVDGFKLNAQTLEKIGSGWMDWRDWSDVTLDELTDTLIIDAKAKNYWWGQPVAGLKAKGIILSQHKAELVSGNTTKLIAFPLPALAYDQKIIWSSSDARIASVDASGLVTAVSSQDASAVITAKTSDGGFTATCEVRVLASAAKIAYPDGTPHQLPGILQVTHYDRGGEGVGYHDLTSANDGDGIRKNEGVDTGMLVEGGNIGGIATGEWLEYTVEVLQEGTYTFEMLFATAGRYGKFRIEMSGVDKTGRLSVIPSGSYTKFVITKVPGIRLEKGMHVMRIFFDYGEYNLGPVTVTREIPSGNKELSAKERIKIYPSPTKGKLFVSGIEKGKIYSIINVYGQVLKSGIISEYNTFDVTFLDAGNYIIRFECQKGCLTGRFVKL